MKLLFKLYEEKPSRIGIVFPYAHTAKQEYENVLKIVESEPCYMKMELLNQVIKLSLRNERTGKFHIYRDLEFDKAQLKHFQNFSLALKGIQVVHVYYNKNNLMVARPENKNVFVSVQHFDLFEGGQVIETKHVE